MFCVRKFTISRRSALILVVFLGLIGIGGLVIKGVPLLEKIGKAVDKKTYFVMLQNSSELRATGGFMGSYVRLKLYKFGISELLIQDIYVPDGKLMGHVEPPYPVQEAFGQGWWKLRDANWEVDFPKSAKAITWFLEQAGENVDGVAVVNISLVQKWLEALGEVRSQTYDETVTAKNLYSLAQKYAEINWTAGSTQKRDFLGAVGVALLEKTKQASLMQKLKLVRLFWGELQKGQILVWVKDEAVEKEILQRKWGGELIVPGESNFLYVVESNLGANKANCCVIRKITQEINQESEQIIINWQNNNPFENPRPPIFWGGDYLDYVRVVVDKEATNIKVAVDGRSLRLGTDKDFVIANSLRQGLSEEMFVVKEGEIGFWAKVPAGKEVIVKINFDTTGKDRVFVKRQPGIESFAYNLIVDGKLVTNTIIDRDTEFGPW